MKRQGKERKELKKRQGEWRELKRDQREKIQIAIYFSGLYLELKPRGTFSLQIGHSSHQEVMTVHGYFCHQWKVMMHLCYIYGEKGPKRGVD